MHRVHVSPLLRRMHGQIFLIQGPVNNSLMESMAIQLSQQKLVNLPFLIIHLFPLIPLSIPLFLLTLKFEQEKSMRKTSLTH